MIHFLKLVVSHPKLVLAATLALTIGFAVVIATRGIYLSGSPETLSRSDSALEFFNETRKTFGDDRVIIVALTTGDVFTPLFIEKLGRLTERLAALDGVDEAQSLTTVKAINRTAGNITIDRLIPKRRPGSYDAVELARLKDHVTSDPLYAKHFISRDGRTAAINIFLRSLDEASVRAVTEEVERVAKEEAGADEVLLAGIPVVEARAIRSMTRDIIVLSPIAALLCMVVFAASFRSFWGAALAMLALAFGLVWTIGLMSAAGRPLTLATLPMPTVLMAVGSSFLFHVLNQHRISMSQLDSASSLEHRRTAWLEGLKFISPAVIVSGTTTTAGFGALASSAVPTARDMGIFEALGVLAMLALSLTFMPAALSLLPANSLGRAGSRQKDYVTWLNGALKHATALILYRRRAVLIGFVVATIVVGAGAAWLRVNTDYLRVFPPSSDTVRDAEKLHERLAGVATVQVVVSGKPGAVTDPAFIDFVGALERFATDQPGVDAAISVVDIIKLFNRDNGTISANNLTRQTSSFTLKSIFDDFLSQDESISRLVSRDRSSAVIVLRSGLTNSNELRRLSGSIEEWARANLPPGISARATGSLILLNDASDDIAASQLSSLAIALATIYGMMVALFRSLSTALLALIPNLIPIVCYFGVLGWTGITLDITTSLVASAALGLAVDNAVHMIRRYRQSVAERNQAALSNAEENEGWAMWLTMLRTGKPMVLANLMLVAAFLIFMLSSFVPVRLAGLLWAVAILTCLVADLIFLPALMKTKLFARAALGDSTAGRVIESTRAEGVAK